MTMNSKIHCRCVLGLAGCGTVNMTEHSSSQDAGLPFSPDAHAIPIGSSEPSDAEPLADAAPMTADVDEADGPVLGIDGAGPIVPVVPALAAMSLAFDDEFDGPSGGTPDTSKWQFSFTGSNQIDYGGGSVLDISLPHLDGAGHCVLPGQYNGGSVANPANYSSGCIITKGGQAGTGFAAVPAAGNRVYMEWRAQLPRAAAGVWPAIWAISNGHPYTEVDMMEQGTGIGPTPPYDAYFTYWTGPDSASQKVAGDRYSAAGSPDLSVAYHVYSTLWTTAAVTWYIDGVQGGSAAIPSTNQSPVAPIADFQIGKGGGGTPDGTGWPRYFYIDYARVFRDH